MQKIHRSEDQQTFMELLKTILTFCFFKKQVLRNIQSVIKIRLD